MEALKEALEAYGNEEGTESQLNQCTEFLEIAFLVMTEKQQAAFLKEAHVREFIAANPGDEET